MSPKVYADLLNHILNPPSLYARITAWVTAKLTRQFRHERP